MARIACAQICKQQGFTSVKESALNTLAEVISRRLLVILILVRWYGHIACLEDLKRA